MENKIKQWTCQKEFQKGTTNQSATKEWQTRAAKKSCKQELQDKQILQKEVAERICKQELQKGIAKRSSEQKDDKDDHVDNQTGNEQKTAYLSLLVRLVLAAVLRGFAFLTLSKREDFMASSLRGLACGSYTLRSTQITQKPLPPKINNQLL